MKAPAVSVIIPCFNQGDTLDDAVASVLDQSFEDIEIVIVNDGSTDDRTKSILTTYRRPRTRVIHTSNEGVAAARNTGVLHSTGRYILPLDSDDRISRDYVAEAVSLMERNPEAIIVYCDGEYFGDRSGKMDLPVFSIEKMLDRNCIFCTALFRRSDFEKTGGYRACAHEDWDFWLTLIEECPEGKVYKIPRTHFHYRVRAGSMLHSMDPDSKRNAKLQIYLGHLPLYERFGIRPADVAHREFLRLPLPPENRGAAQIPRSSLRSVAGQVKRSWKTRRTLRREAVCVLMYHRIDRVRHDPWGLAVTPSRFAEHLEVIERYGQPITLNDATRSLEARRLPAGGIVVTLDDGYRDNLVNAKPLLEKFGVPATVFVASDSVDQTPEYWWDQLSRLLLHEGGPPLAIQLCVRGHRLRWEREDFDSDFDLYASVHDVVQGLESSERAEVFRQLLDVCGDRRPPSPPSCLSHEELRALAEGGLVQIGSHTAGHRQLPLLSVSRQRAEILAGKRDLESLLDRRVLVFAYPYGQHSATTVNLVRAAGFDCACTVEPKLIAAASDPCRLPRFKVDDWDGDEFQKRLTTWFQN